MTAAADNAALALLRGGVIDVYDSYVEDSDGDAKTISAPLPYLFFTSRPGEVFARRATGLSRDRGTEFQVTAVGETREQAVLAGDKAEALLDGKSIVADGRTHIISRTDEAPPISRDDEWTRPGGRPLFLDVRRYSVPC